MVDCFKLDRILALDPEAAHGARAAGRDPGVPQSRPPRVLRARVRARHRHDRPGDHRRHGGQQLVGVAFHRLRRVATTRYGASRPCSPAATPSCSGRRPAASSSRGSAARGRGRGGRDLAADLTAIRGRYGARPSRPASRTCAAAPPATTCGSCSRREPNLGKLLAGSEGTLALFTELEVALDRSPAARLGAASRSRTCAARSSRTSRSWRPVRLPSSCSTSTLCDARPTWRPFASLASLLDGDEQATAHRGVPGRRRGGA